VFACVSQGTCSVGSSGTAPSKMRRRGVHRVRTSSLIRLVRSSFGKGGATYDVLRQGISKTA